MKLRIKGNSLRLRLNQTEVMRLADGATLEEAVSFPGDTSLSYQLTPAHTSAASFTGNVIKIAIPPANISAWAKGDDIGLYFDFPAASEPLKVAIEKDLECVDGPLEERDLDAFPRLAGKNC